MPTYIMPNLSGGIDNAIVDVAETVSIFTPMFLFFIFCTVFLGGVISQKRRTGNGDMPLWATISSISTLLIALPMTFISGLIQIEILVVLVVVTIFSGLWLFNDKGRNEV